MSEEAMETVETLPTLEDLNAEAERLVHQAVHRKLTITTAESCTGGLVSHLLTDVAGASGTFVGGWVVYANHRKVALGVPEAMLNEHGAVSAPTARALAERTRIECQADIAVATTGIAGPTGGTKAKPVGTVYIGIATEGATVAHHVWVKGGDRAALKRAFAMSALRHLQAAVDAAATTQGDGD